MVFNAVCPLPRRRFCEREREVNDDLHRRESSCYTDSPFVTHFPAVFPRATMFRQFARENGKRELSQFVIRFISRYRASEFYRNRSLSTDGRVSYR